jgi:hypothetical protein
MGAAACTVDELLVSVLFMSVSFLASVVAE